MGELATGADRGERARDRHLVRLDVVRFPLIVLIVYLHACGYTINFADGTRVLLNARIVDDVQFVTGSIARVAVPLFFLMSGFLFFRGTDFSVSIYLGKLRSRARSLLMPFLFWNLALLGLVAVAQTTPVLAPFFNGRNQAFATFTPFQILDAIVGITHYPIAYQFWFIRDLMILVLASPLLWLAARYFAWPTLGLFAAAWLLIIWPVTVPECEPVLFFYLGCMVAIRGGSLFALDRMSWWISLLAVLMLAGFYVERNAGYGDYLLRPAVAIALVLALKSSRWLADSKLLRDWLVSLGRASFFVFATHEPLVTIGKKIVFRIFPMTAETVLIAYAVLPALIICIILLVYRVVLETLPGFLRLITGGR